ncbi:MAG: 2-phosphosulfolactate phosphatase [Balneolaceae bacterium]
MGNLDNLDVFFSVQSFQEEELRGKTVVITDVLRATSTMVTAIKNGAKGIIPVGDMGEASKIAQNVNSDNYLLCGEKNGLKIDGFDLGNSPLEYTPEKVGGKTLIFNTTNGTKAVKKSMSADEVYIAAFLNLDRVVEVLRRSTRDIILICSGWQGRLSLEDLLLAGNIIYNLRDGIIDHHSSDGSKVAFGLYEKFGNDLKNAIFHSNHAARLKNIVGEEDIDYCCQLNITDVLPVLSQGIIINHDSHVEKTE